MPEGNPAGYSNTRDPNTGRVLRDRFQQLRSSYGEQGQGLERTGMLERAATELVQSRGAPVTPQNVQMALEYLRGGGMGQFDQQQATEAAIADQIMAAEGGAPVTASSSRAPDVGVMPQRESAPAPSSTSAPPMPSAGGAPASPAMPAPPQQVQQPMPPVVSPPDDPWSMPLGAGEMATVSSPYAVQRPMPVDPNNTVWGREVPKRDVAPTPATPPISLLPSDDPSGPGVLRDQPEGTERGQFNVDTPSGPYDYTLYLGENGMYNTIAPDGRRLVARTAQEIEHMLRTGATETQAPLESMPIGTDELF